MMNLDRDVQQTLEKIFRQDGFIDAYRYHAFTAFTFIKRMEAMATWLAKYRQLSLMHEGDLPHDDAVALANKAVRDTQGAGSPVDLPALWRGDTSFWSEVGKLGNMFTGFENTSTNRGWTMIRRGPRIVKGFRDAGWQGARRDFTSNLSWLLTFFLIPAVYSALLRSGTQGKGEQLGDQIVENLLKSTLGGTIPYGNEIANFPAQAVTFYKRHELDFGGSGPLEEMVGEGIATAVNAAQVALGQAGKVEDRWVQHAIDTAGYIGGLPLKPFSKGGQWLWDKTQGHVQDESIVEWLRGLAFGSTPAEAKKPPTPSHSRGRRGR
jgi:hypothetical protein